MINSCNLIPKGKEEINEGQVIYKITYPKELNEHTMSFLFPKEMNLFFKDDKQRATFKGTMNLYSLDFIHLNKSDSFFTLMKVLDKKLYVPNAKSGDIFLFQNYTNEKVIFSRGETRKIAGFNCEKAEIKPNNSDFPDITIWYTNDIGVNNPNRNTPFEKIPGVMLEFEVSYQSIVFHFKADKVIPTEVAEEVFMVPDTYTTSTISEIEELINGVLK
jgi:GLPGLI family protein